MLQFTALLLNRARISDYNITISGDSMEYRHSAFHRFTLHASALMLLSILIFFASAGSVFGAQSRPWYATRLEALGFYVFDQPFEQPNFNVTSVDGQMKSRLSTKGNITLLNFWATWCPPCKQEIPTIQKLHETMKGEKFEIMAVDLGESAKSVKAFLDQNKISYPVYVDPKSSLTGLYASRGIPTTYILDKNGKFIAGFIGPFEYDNPEFVSIMKELARK
jgi:thiol-disulfide isomerase/thioredoxin